MTMDPGTRGPQRPRGCFFALLMLPVEIVKAFLRQVGFEI